MKKFEAIINALTIITLFAFGLIGASFPFWSWYVFNWGERAKNALLGTSPIGIPLFGLLFAGISSIPFLPYYLYKESKDE